MFTASSTRVACRVVFGPGISRIPVHACLAIGLRVAAHGHVICEIRDGFGLVSDELVLDLSQLALAHGIWS